MPSQRSTRPSQAHSRRTGSQSGGEKPARQTTGTKEDPLHLHDPREIRALAHPARLAVIDALASGDELTATECAALTGLSPSATAYHLNLLARYGFLEPASARNDGRERPWRATDRRVSVDIDTSTPARAAAAARVGLAYFDRTRAIGERWLTGAHEEPREWQDAAILVNADVWLTLEETQKLTAALTAAVAPYRGRTLAKRKDDARRVRVMNMVVPHRGH